MDNTPQISKSTINKSKINKLFWPLKTQASKLWRIKPTSLGSCNNNISNNKSKHNKTINKKSLMMVIYNQTPNVKIVGLSFAIT